MSSINTRKRSKGGIIDGQNVKVGDRPVRIPGASAEQERESGNTKKSNGDVQVECLTDQEGTVRKIVVQCACGEQTVIECKYKGE